MAFHVSGRWGLNGERREFSAICKIAIVPFDGGSKLARRWDTEVEVPALLPMNGYIQKPVLVSIVKVADDSEQWRKDTVRSVVRLYRLDNCPHCETQRLNAPELLRESNRTIRDGELKYPVIGRGISARLMDRDGVDKIVESRPEVMDTISADQRPTVPLESTIEVDDNTVMAKIGFSVRGDRVRLSFFPSKDFFADRLSMCLCTPDLQPTPY